jgi:HEAT repeat protein
MGKRGAILCLTLGCASPVASGPAMTPSPSRNPDSSAAAAMSPSQPLQQQDITTIPQPETTTQDQRAHVQVMLESRDSPAPKETLLSEGRGVFHALDAIFRDRTAKLATRGRALASMANLDDERGFAELHEVLNSPSTGGSQVFFARVSIGALARAQGARAVRAIAGAFVWKDPTVRIAGAEALGQIGGPDARGALQHQLDEESDPGVRDALQKALAKATP